MKILKLFLVLAFALFCHNNLLASRTPDRIIYQGNTYPLYGHPMEQYFAQFPEKQPNLKDLNVNTTESETGYVATLEFVDNQLYLKDFQLVQGFGYIGKSLISELLSNNESLKVDWLSKSIILKKGKAVKKDPTEGFIYESYVILELKNGKLIKAQELSYQEYRNYSKR